VDFITYEQKMLLLMNAMNLVCMFQLS